MAQSVITATADESFPPFRINPSTMIEFARSSPSTHQSGIQQQHAKQTKSLRPITYSAEESRSYDCSSSPSFQIKIITIPSASHSPSNNTALSHSPHLQQPI